MSQVKICVFADLHHYPGIFYTNAEQRLTAIQQRAAEHQVDAIVSLGDFCHRPEESAGILAQFHNFPIPSYMVMGNHDTDGTALSRVLELYRMPGAFYYFDLKGFRFIAVDTNYLPAHAGFVHGEFGNYFKCRDFLDTIAPEELDFLRDAIFTSPYPCLLFSHCSLERESHPGLSNRAELMQIVRDANRIGDHRVMLSVNGHHHRDFLRFMEGAAWFDLNSASYDWINNAHDFYPPELCAEFTFAKHTVIYNDPLSAIITLDDRGNVTIEGVKSSMFMGVSREMTDNPACDHAGRPCVPEVLSASFKLWQ